MATSKSVSLRKARVTAATPLQQVMNRSYEAFLQWVSEEALAELCEAAAQEMGFTELPTRQRDLQRKIMFRAYEIHQQRQWERRQQQARGVQERRRARKAGAPDIEKFTRQEIIDRDQSICHICGKTCDPTEIHLDHVIPLSKGGAHTRANVKVACAPCNIRKADTMPTSEPATVSAT